MQHFSKKNFDFLNSFKTLRILKWTINTKIKQNIGQKLYDVVRIRLKYGN